MGVSLKIGCLPQSCPQVEWTRESGHKFADFCKARSPLQVLYFVTDRLFRLFLVSEIDMNLWILHLKE